MSSPASSTSSVSGVCPFKGKFFKPNTCDLCGLQKSQHGTPTKVTPSINKQPSNLQVQPTPIQPVASQVPPKSVQPQPTYAALPTSPAVPPSSNGAASSSATATPPYVAGNSVARQNPVMPVPTANIPVQSGNPVSPTAATSTIGVQRSTPAAVRGASPASASPSASAAPSKPSPNDAYYNSAEAKAIRKNDEAELMARWEQALEYSDPDNCSDVSAVCARIKNSKHWSQAERTRVMTDLFGKIISHLYEQYRLYPRSVVNFYMGAPLAHTLGYISQCTDNYMRSILPNITLTIENHPQELERFSWQPAGGPDINGKLCYQFIVWLFAAFGHLNSVIEDNDIKEDRITPKMANAALELIEPAITSIFGTNFPLRKKILSLNENSPPLNSGDPETDEAYERLKKTIPMWLEISISMRKPHHCMFGMVHLLDDEPLLILHADEQWGCIVKIRGICSNFQLTQMLTNTLHAYSGQLRSSLPGDLQQLFTAWHPYPANVFSTITGEGPWMQKEVSMEERWTMWNYFAVERSGLSYTGRPLFRCAKDGKNTSYEYRVFGELDPWDIEKCEYALLPTVEPSKEGNLKAQQLSLEKERKEQESRYVATCHAEMIAGAAINHAYANLSANSAPAAPAGPPKLPATSFAGLPSRVLVLSRLVRQHASTCMRVYPHLKAGCYYQRTLSHEEVVNCLTAFADCSSTFKNKAEEMSKKRIGAPISTMREYQGAMSALGNLQLAQLLGIGFQRR